MNFIKINTVLILTFFMCFSMSVKSADITEVGAANNTENRFVGYAYSLDGEELLYSEHHLIMSTADNQRLYSTVHYKSSEGKVIADKTLKYDETGYFPSFNFLDLRTDQILNVENFGKKITITQGDNLAEKGRRDVESINPLKKGVMIADAGFDVFMMKNWPALTAGETKIVDFLAPTRGMFVSFEIKQIFKNNSIVQFSLAPDNFFISMLVDPIFLEYDLASGRILSYKGLTNVEQSINGKATGNNYIAHIKYKYSDDPLKVSAKNGI